MLGLSLFATAASLAGRTDAQVYPGCATPPASFSHRLIANAANFTTVLSKARGGDAIYLASGNYGAVVISGANPGFITVAAAPGQTPTFSSLEVKGSRWVLRGLNIVGLSPPHLFGRGRAHLPLVNIAGGENLVFEGNTVASALGSYPWREEVLPGQADETTIINQPATADGIHVLNAGCVSIVNNHVSNIFNGIMVTGDQQQNHGRFYLISGNSIDNFAGDGIDYGVSDALISRNIITNAQDICKQLCVHSDGIQGWTYNDRPDIVDSNVVIDSNRIFARLGPPTPFSDGPIQGVTIFDGRWKNVTVTNNLIVVTAYHGIAIGGVDGLLIANNTVVGTSRHATWIAIGGDTRQGGQPDHVTVANNISMQFKTGKLRRPIPHLQMDHNLALADLRSAFRTFDPARGAFDLHPRPNSGAFGQGDPRDAAKVDIDGKPRKGSITLGAYQ